MAYINGRRNFLVKITGENIIPNYDGKVIEAYAINEDHESVYFRADIDTPIVVRDHFDVRIPFEKFGTAQASDVRKGETFTSIDGFQVEGTNDTNGGITEVSELPTKNIRTDTLYFYNGKYYKRNASNVWVFDEKIQAPSEDFSVSLKFNSDNCNYVLMETDGEALYYTFSGDTKSDPVYYFNEERWVYDGYRTITVTKRFNNENFIAWLNDNATNEGSWEVFSTTGSTDDSIVGTWVFNDILTPIPEELIGKNIYFRYSVYASWLYVNAKMDRITIFEEGSGFSYSGDEGGDGYCFEDVYEYAYGWLQQDYKTIKIIEAPTDEALIAWLKANATKVSGVGGATAYTVSSVDELPSDAPDGSMAIVESDSISLYIRENGQWVYKGDVGAVSDGGEEVESPSCLVVVGNYSTEPFEVTVKMLVENNEVVDNTGYSYGYGEYAEFHNTQKGSVAILKTTLPVIVRDAFNQEIIYSNSEYVEVDEANQMTYVTIPMDCAVVEIVVELAE